MNTITKKLAVFSMTVAAVAAAASPSFARTQRVHSDAGRAAVAHHVQQPANAAQWGQALYGAPAQTNIYQCKIDDGYGRWSDCDSGQSG